MMMKKRTQQSAPTIRERCREIFGNELLQPELFRYLFPLCLAEWRKILLANKGDDFLSQSLISALRQPLGGCEPWTVQNLVFLRQELTSGKLLVGIQAARRLRDEPEDKMAARIAEDALKADDIIIIQIEDVLNELCV